MHHTFLGKTMLNHLCSSILSFQEPTVTMSPHGERGHRRGPTVAPTFAPKLTHLLAQSGTHGTHGSYGTNNVPTLVPRNNARSTTATPATTTPSPALMSFTTAALMQESSERPIGIFTYINYNCINVTKNDNLGLYQ